MKRLRIVISPASRWTVDFDDGVNQSQNDVSRSEPFVVFGTKNVRYDRSNLESGKGLFIPLPENQLVANLESAVIATKLVRLSSGHD